MVIVSQKQSCFVLFTLRVLSSWIVFFGLSLPLLWLSLKLLSVCKCFCRYLLFAILNKIEFALCCYILVFPVVFYVSHVGILFVLRVPSYG